MNNVQVTGSHLLFVMSQFLIYEVTLSIERTIYDGIDPNSWTMLFETMKVFGVDARKGGRVIVRILGKIMGSVQSCPAGTCTEMETEGLFESLKAPLHKCIMAQYYNNRGIDMGCYRSRDGDDSLIDYTNALKKRRGSQCSRGRKLRCIREHSSLR